MKITLNGETTEVEPGTTLRDLIERLDLQGKRLAVEANGDIVPKSRHDEHELADGDRIEIVRAIGGG